MLYLPRQREAEGCKATPTSAPLKHRKKIQKKIDGKLCIGFRRDEGMALRSRLSGAGFKPPQAAVVKSHGRER